MNKQHNIDAIDAILPQTQCGLCTYKGCKPYATAIVENEASVDLCLPGGVSTLKTIGDILQIDTTSLHNSMQQKSKPPMLAVIRESECIGCTKCIQACPVDAIIGAPKLMHTVITDACNGCELCVTPCPVDCIDMITVDEINETEKIALREQSRVRYNQRNKRLTRIEKQAHEKHLQAKKAKQANAKQTISARRAAIDAILKRKQHERLPH